MTFPGIQQILMFIYIGRILHFVPRLLHEAIPSRVVRTQVAAVPQEAPEAHPPIPWLRWGQRAQSAYRWRTHCPVEQRRPPIGQYVHGECDDLNELDQVAVDDRSSASGNQVDQEPVWEEAHRHQDRPERISGYHWEVCLGRFFISDWSRIGQVWLGRENVLFLVHVVLLCLSSNSVCFDWTH